MGKSRGRPPAEIPWWNVVSERRIVFDVTEFVIRMDITTLDLNRKTITAEMKWLLDSILNFETRFTVQCESEKTLHFLNCVCF